MVPCGASIGWLAALGNRSGAAADRNSANEDEPGAVAKCRILLLLLEALRVGEQCVGHPGDISGGSQVPSIVIAAVNNNALVTVDRVVILMTDSVNAGNHSSAALAVHEIDRLPDTAVPGAVADNERPGKFAPGADLVSPWFL